MGERGEVARAPEAAVLADDRGDASVQQRGVRLGDERARAGAGGGEGGEPQQHGGAHHLALDLGTRARRVRADEGALQLRTLVHRDVGRRERPKPG